jgi:outer membrane protein TolC
VHEIIVAVARQREGAAAERVKAGHASKAEYLQALAQRIDAEVARERARVAPETTTLGAKVQPAENAGVRALLQKRLDALKEMAEQAEAASRHGTVAPGEVVRARLQVLAAALALCQTDAERVKVHERIVAQAKELEAIADKLVQAGRAPQSELLKARAERLDAEIELERVKARAAGSRGN